MEPDRYVVRWPTLFIVPDWIERHCPQPDRFGRGGPMRLYETQLWWTLNHYRVKPTAVWRPENPMLAAAFHNRRSQIIAPQKYGKGPWTAGLCSAEGVGPVLFAGWATEGDAYRCEDNGCGCGWIYQYETGEAKGMRWPTPLIQVTATSEDQADNVFRHIRSMIRLGPLGDLMRVGENMIRIGTEGEIVAVTSSAASKLGNPLTFAVQDESGIYTDTNKLRHVAETQRRGAAGMGGRTLETTNAYDPSQDSVAQRTREAQAEDVFKFYEPPPANLSYRNKRERRKIHAFVYAGAPHIEVDSIDAEAAELAEKDPEQAERFYGNRMVYGAGTWLDGDSWDARARPDRVVRPGTPVVAGFDGSDVDDWTAIRLQTEDGYQFTPRYGPDRRPAIWNPAQHGGQVPRLEVRLAWDEIVETYQLIRAYLDPPGWKTEIDELAERYGDKVFLRWETYRITQMHAALLRLHTDVVKADATFTHDGDQIVAAHVRNARKLARAGQKYILGKPSQQQKIDAVMSAALCNEAAGDVTAGGLWQPNVTAYAYSA